MQNNRAFNDQVAFTSDAYGTGVALGASIDRQGIDGFAHFLVDVGTPGTSATLAIKAQESADNSTWTDVPADGKGTAAALALQTTAAGRLRLDLKLRKRKRYVRLHATVAVAAYDFGAWCVLTGMKNEDAAPVPTVDHGYEG